MTVIARRNTSHDRIPPPDRDAGPDPVVARLRRRHWMVVALAVLLLAGVVRAAVYLTALSPVTAGAGTSAAVDPWGPHPLGTRPWQFARLLSSGQPKAAERVAPAALPVSPVRADAALRLLVDQGWTALRPAAIPAAARTAGIAVSPQSASP